MQSPRPPAAAGAEIHWGPAPVDADAGQGEEVDSNLLAEDETATCLVRTLNAKPAGEQRESDAVQGLDGPLTSTQDAICRRRHDPPRTPVLRRPLLLNSLKKAKKVPFLNYPLSRPYFVRRTNESTKCPSVGLSPQSSSAIDAAAVHVSFDGEGNRANKFRLIF